MAELLLSARCLPIPRSLYPLLRTPVHLHPAMIPSLKSTTMWISRTSGDFPDPSASLLIDSVKVPSFSVNNLAYVPTTSSSFTPLAIHDTLRIQMCCTSKSYNSEIPFLQLTHILTLQDYHWEATNLSPKPLASSWLYQLPTQNEISKSDVLIPSPKHYVRRGYYCYVVPYASIFTSSGSTTFKFLTYASRYQGLLKKVTRVS